MKQRAAREEMGIEGFRKWDMKNAYKMNNTSRIAPSEVFEWERYGGLLGVLFVLFVNV